jgi:LCP family protein required for cell wall assembly
MGGAAGRPRLWGAAGKSGYVLSCLLAAVTLLVSGFSYFVVRDVSAIGSSHAITSGPSIGAQNILLMGLESRRDWNGNILPGRVLAALHSGNAQQVANGTGGNDTNTLILIHIFAGGHRAVGFSIPRDDWVKFGDTVGPQQTGKIDQAYGVSMYYQQAKLRNQRRGMGQDQLAFLGNEAGRAAAVATVERLTGVHVDHFAEVNLFGFWEVAKVLGGVEVCLKHPVPYDPNSGAHFRAGYQHLDAAQALSFVRQRDGLPNGDLDRTHRQQAFIDSVIHQLRTGGVLGDLSKLQALLTVAKRYVIADAGWNLLDFAIQARSLTSGNITFRTLPIKGYANIAGQDVNVVDPAQIKRIVHAAFYPRPAPRGAHRHRPTATKTPAGPPPGSTTVDVFNGGYTAGLAGRVSAALAKAGYRAGQVSNTAYRTSTAVLYGPGAAARANAARIAAMFGVKAAAGTSVAAGHVEIMLGTSATVPHISPSSGTSSTPSPGSGARHTRGPQGGAVTAKNGIPCVN